MLKLGPMPDYIAGKVEDVTPKNLTEAGYSERLRAVIYDVDGTLMPYHAHELEPSVENYLREMGERGVQLFIASNAYGERVDELCEIFNGLISSERITTPGISRDDINLRKFAKPNPAMLNRIMKENRLTGRETLVVGDQLLKDVAAANDSRSPGLIESHYEERIFGYYVNNYVRLPISKKYFTGSQTFKPEVARSVLVPRRGDEDHLGVRLFQRPAEAALRAVNGLPLLSRDFPDGVKKVQ